MSRLQNVQRDLVLQDVQHDIVLLASLSYLMFDTVSKWDSYAACPSPIHKWLVGSYVLLIVWRFAVVSASLISSMETSTVLLNLRHKNVQSQVMVSFAAWVVPLLVAAWSVVGSFWTWDVMTKAPDCMPSGLHLCFLLVWQVMSYAWFSVNMFTGSSAWLMEHRVRQAEQDLRALEDDDSRSRWGSVGNLEGYTDLPAMMAGGGLTPAVIRSLPGVGCLTPEDVRVDTDCPICLNPLQAGETVRQLDACSHEFHRSCIDLWLLRSAECPMCKSKVAASSA